MKCVMLSNIRIAMRLCLLLFVVALLPCCKDSRKICDGCLHEIYVPLLEDEFTEYPIVSKLFGSIDTVYLENVGPESYIAAVDDVKFHDGRIIVRSGAALYFFDSTGKFLSRFNRQGNGSGNYRTIARFDILSSKQEVIILDNPMMCGGMML